MRAMRPLLLFFAFGTILGACATGTVVVPDDDGGIGNPDSGGPCTTMCGGMCADLKTDGANCGKCGVACPMGATCIQGSCQCAMAQTKCGSTCVDTKTDIQNCGKCGTICGNDAGAILGGGMWGCTAGTCGIICPAPKVECSGECDD